MFKVHNPTTIAQPLLPTYSNGLEAPPNARWLFISGQVGVDKDGKVLPDYAAQCRQIWVNITEILKSANMTVNDIIKMTAYVVHGQNMAAYGKIRSEFLAGHRPASTMITVPALLTPEMLIEVEVIGCAK